MADQRLYAQKYQVLMARGRPHAVLLQALEEREPNLRVHVGGVARLSLLLAAQLGIADAALEELGLAAQLHDVGKLAIPDSVLSKTEPLDESELAFIRQHTLIGQRILDASPALNEVGRIVRATHERWDGDGYPDGLVGDGHPASGANHRRLRRVLRDGRGPRCTARCSPCRPLSPSFAAAPAASSIRRWSSSSAGSTRQSSPRSPSRAERVSG